MTLKLPYNLSALLTLPFWRHRKRGTVYIEVGRGTFQTDEAPGLDNHEVVVYIESAPPHNLWVRPTREFVDGRFVASTPPAQG